MTRSDIVKILMDLEEKLRETRWKIIKEGFDE